MLDGEIKINRFLMHYCRMLPRSRQEIWPGDCLFENIG
jgi:hypothetical protein